MCLALSTMARDTVVVLVLASEPAVVGPWSYHGHHHPLHHRHDHLQLSVQQMRPTPLLATHQSCRVNAVANGNPWLNRSCRGRLG